MGASPARQQYGTTSLEQRSRSPSPTSHRRHGSQAPHPHSHTGHSYPVLTPGGGRRGAGRRLPATPNKPSTLHLSPQQQQQFPHLNRSPTGTGVGGAVLGAASLPVPGGVAGSKLGAPPLNANINFPKLNASPTHGPKAASDLPYIGIGSSGRRIVSATMGRYEEPLSFEQAMAMGRGGPGPGLLSGSGRQLPSPVPNGFKPGSAERRPGAPRGADQRRPGRHSDSDEDDWC